MFVGFIVSLRDGFYKILENIIAWDEDWEFHTKAVAESRWSYMKIGVKEPQKGGIKALAISQLKTILR